MPSTYSSVSASSFSSYATVNLAPATLSPFVPSFINLKVGSFSISTLIWFPEICIFFKSGFWVFKIYSPSLYSTLNSYIWSSREYPGIVSISCSWYWIPSYKLGIFASPFSSVTYSSVFCSPYCVVYVNLNLIPDIFLPVELSTLFILKSNSLYFSFSIVIWFSLFNSTSTDIGFFNSLYSSGAFISVISYCPLSNINSIFPLLSVSYVHSLNVSLLTIFNVTPATGSPLSPTFWINKELCFNL